MNLNSGVQDFPGKGFGAFWMGGNLPSIEQACLHSFAIRGQEVTLFCYDGVENAPDGVRVANASEILPRESTHFLKFNGQPHLGHFSDYFRYNMIKTTGLVWIDADMLLFDRVFSKGNNPNLVCKEEQGGVNGAILYIGTDELIDVLISETESLFGKSLKWGETGPLLLKRLVKSSFDSRLYDSALFYPIEHFDIWKILLPQYLGWCREKCKNAVTIHLFNNILTRIGYWKSMAPPVGSYLYECLSNADGLKFFDNTYPEEVANAMITNFRLSQNGKALGIKTVIQEIIPSIGRTYQHYVKR